MSLPMALAATEAHLAEGQLRRSELSIKETTLPQITSILFPLMLFRIRQTLRVVICDIVILYSKLPTGSLSQSAFCWKSHG